MSAGGMVCHPLCTPCLTQTISQPSPVRIQILPSHHQPTNIIGLSGDDGETISRNPWVLEGHALKTFAVEGLRPGRLDLKTLASVYGPE